MKKDITEGIKGKMHIIEEIQKLVEKEKMDITFKNKINSSMLSIDSNREISADLYQNIVM